MKLTSFFRSGYTLVELLIALSISLFLLLGVTELFRNVGTSITDTQKTLNMAANLNNVGIRLRDDLACINADINQPSKMADGSYTTDRDGYFEIGEGMNVPARIAQNNHNGRHVLSENVFVDSATGSVDPTVGDVDDILMFTATSENKSYPFRGLVNGQIQESVFAEIAWFVRGKTLYRRVLLVDDKDTFRNLNLTSSNFYRDNDISVRRNGSSLIPNKLVDLKKRENRFGHSTGGGFPYPIYYYNSSDDREGWYYLRLPTMEETVNSGWNIARELPSSSLSSPSGWDLWDQPYPWASNLIDQTSGSISNSVTNPRSKRAGDDIVLTNVLSFDVKVWNKYWVPLVGNYWAPPQYIDLGQDQLYDESGTLRDVNYGFDFDNPPSGVTVPTDHGYGFTTKGRYNASSNFRVSDDSTEWYKAERLAIGTNDDNSTINQLWTGTAMPCVYDTWTIGYENVPGDNTATELGANTKNDGYATNSSDFTYWRCPPPYTEPLQALQITIRCYDPDSGNIRQLRIVHHVN